MKVRTEWVHPVLFAAYPVLALFAHNEDEVLLRTLWAPLMFSVVGAGVVLALARVVVRDLQRAALITSVLVLLSFSYGHVFVPVFISVLGRHRAVLVVWLVVSAILVLLIARHGRTAARMTRLLNVMALVLVVVATARIVAYEATQRVAAHNVLTELRADAAALPVLEPHGYAPDIYYFVMDRYPNEKTLQEAFGFDNGEFLSFLRQRDFVVLSNARANYATTPLSLASSLNMEHLNKVRDLVGEETTDTSVTFGLLTNHRVQRLLRQRGYEYVHLGSWWEPTRHNEFADLNVTYSFPVSEFTRELLETTVAWPLFYRLVDFTELHRKQVLFKLSKFRDIVAMSGPKFVFAHFLLPHPPYVFDRDGRRPTDGQLAERTEQESFIQQLEFTNARLREIIDGILRDSERRPVIILQSDEGPHMAEMLHWGKKERMREDVIRMKTYILNALYLPGVPAQAVPDSLTPVNTFRLVFNEYFGADYPLLENASYWFEDAKRPYRFVDVTHVRY